jgi:hypothetical protein
VGAIGYVVCDLLALAASLAALGWGGLGAGTVLGAWGAVHLRHGLETNGAPDTPCPEHAS